MCISRVCISLFGGCVTVGVDNVDLAAATEVGVTRVLAKSVLAYLGPVCSTHICSPPARPSYWS